MRELYEVIAGIEGQAVKLAAERADAEMVRHLQAALADQEEALAADDRASWTRADQRFHQLLREAAGNQRMLELMRQFDGQLHRARVATIHLRSKPRQSTEEHRAVLEAIVARDPERERRLHVAHRERADAAMLEVIRDYSGMVLRTLVAPAATESRIVQ